MRAEIRSFIYFRKVLAARRLYFKSPLHMNSSSSSMSNMSNVSIRLSSRCKGMNNRCFLNPHLLETQSHTMMGVPAVRLLRQNPVTHHRCQC